MLWWMKNALDRKVMVALYIREEGVCSLMEEELEALSI